MVCCLLSITSSFNLTVLVDVFYRNFPEPNPRSVVSEMQEAIDEDTDMLHSSNSLDVRRGDRKLVLLTVAVQRLDDGAAIRTCVSSDPTSLSFSRWRCEHAHRNGLGAPLLC